MKRILSLVFALALILGAVSALADGTPSICIVVAGSLGDRSFYDSAYEGIQKLAADFGTNVNCIECYEDSSLYEQALYDAAASYDMVAAVGWQFWDALASEDGVVSDNPDTKFLFIDNALDEIPENLVCITYTQNEGSFLAGYVAASLSTTGVIGVVGGEDSDTINDFIVGYEAGAQYKNADIRVLRQYAGTYEDPAKGKECARALYDMGADVVFAVAGRTGEGVFSAAREVNRLAIGVDGDQKYIDPDRIVCSMVKRVGQSIYDMVADPETYWCGGQAFVASMASGYIGLAYGTDDMPQQVSDELKAELEVIRQQIIDGSIVVPTAFGD
jgi:basic membrane protein A